MREIVLHDTLSGELLPLRPRDPGRVGIYACGPTVYSRIHIGNARPFVVFSLLKRFLEHDPYSGITNITKGNNAFTDFDEEGNPLFTIPGFEAHPGYNMATGLGSVDALTFAHALAGR